MQLGQGSNYRRAHVHAHAGLQKMMESFFYSQELVELEGFSFLPLLSALLTLYCDCYYSKKVVPVS